MLAVFLGILSLLIFAKPVIAGEPPIQTNPDNNSTVSSPTLNWQTPLYQICLSNDAYRVQVDDNPSFPSSSIYRNVYTKNTYYTPQLTSGTWYWRVMARDETCNNWSAWSNVWSFTLETSTSPTPSITSSPAPTTTPAPSSPNPTNTPISSSFTISNIPSQINSDESFIVSVNLSLPNNPSTKFYLKGAFKKADTANYFGQTLVSGSWIKNGSSYSSQFPLTSDSFGNWSGSLEIKPDSGDSGFNGTGDYIFKVARYTNSGSGPSWSDETTIKIISKDNNQGDDIPIKNNSSITNPPATSPAVKIKPTTSPRSKSYDRLVYHSASVAGAKASASASASSSPTIELKDQKRINPFLWVGLIFILIGVGSIGYIYLKKNGKLPF